METIVDKEKLPKPILKHFDKMTEIIQIILGHSNDYVYKCITQKKVMYLKTSEKGNLLKKEYQNIKWLHNKIPVPNIIEWVYENGISYLLMSEIPGKMLCDEFYLGNPEITISILADGLKLLHSIDITNCPINSCLDIRLRNATKNIENGQINLDDWKSNNEKFLTPNALLDYLKDNKPEKEELSFSHGDYCLPNVFGEGMEIAGFIDLGYAGIADKWEDISTCLRSIRRNLQTDEYDELLLKKIGIPINYEKIEYYDLLNELL